jgi:hypothetical protein
LRSTPDDHRSPVNQLSRRPVGLPVEADFEIIEAELAGSGELGGEEPDLSQDWLGRYCLPSLLCLQN